VTCAVGSQGLIAVDDNAFASQDWTDDATTDLYEFLSESVKGTQQQIDVSGMTGSRQRRAQALIDGPVEVAGDIELYMTPIDLDEWLPRFGFSESVDVFTFTETVPEFGLLIDRVATMTTQSTFGYKGCKVGRIVISGTAGGPVTMRISIVGRTEVADSVAATFATAAFNLAENAQPYVFHEGVLTYGTAGAFEYNQFELTIDNYLEARQENALTAAEICTTDLGVFLNFNAPWTAAYAPDYNRADITGSLVFTKATSGTDLVTTFAFGELIQTQNPPNISDKSNIRWDVQLEARLAADGVEPAIKITNDTTV